MDVFRQRLQETLLRDPGYISLSIRWLGWLIGLATVLLGATAPESLLGAPLALALGGGQLLLLTLNPGWLRFEVGKDHWTRGAVLRPAADMAIALFCLYLTGGWNSPLYHFAVTTVLAPSLRYGLLGSFVAASVFSVGFSATVWATPLGFSPAYAHGQASPDLVSTLANPLLVGLFAAFLGEVLQRLQFERARAESMASAQERARLARDIHDGVAQTLFMLTMSLESGLVMAQKEGAEKTARYLDSLTPISRKALLELRNAMHNLEPLAAGEQTLEHALRQLIRDYQSATSCTLTFRADESFVSPSGATSSELFRMIQETLTNACHHAEATTIEVLLSQKAATVIDDGKGFDVTTVQRGRGLDNLKSRAEQSAMMFEIGPRPDGLAGTWARINW